MSKVMETIAFPGGSEPYQVRDGRIPENPGNYQYLVTDGDGQWGTADRLAYYEREAIDIQWDGSTEGKITALENENIIRISEDVLENDTIKAGTLSYFGTETVVADEWDTVVSQGYVTEDLTYLGSIIFVRKANAQLVEREDNILTFPEPGVYSPIQVAEGVIFRVPAITVPIDPAKWLPEGYPYEKTEKVYHKGLDNFSFNGTSARIETGFGIWATQGMTCYIVYDGVEYTAEIDNDSSFYGMGLGDENFVEYPFYVYLNNMDGYVEVRAATNGEHTISVYAYETVINKMAGKFLPSGVPVVPVTSADNGKFLQVVNGAWAAVAVTDVSQEGA